MSRRFHKNPFHYLRRISFSWLTLLLILASFPRAAEAQHVNYLNITGQATTAVKTAPGILHNICFNNPVATEVVTIYDNTAASGTKIGTITVPASPMMVCLVYNVNFNIALTILTATASSDITVTWE